MFTPFEIIFGRKAVLPVDINEGVQADYIPSIDDDDIEEAMKCLTNNRIRIMKKVS